jgi:hypothetical protein
MMIVFVLCVKMERILCAYITKDIFHVNTGAKSMRPRKGKRIEMTKGEMEYAIRKSLNQFDEWNDCTGCFIKGSGYYYEAQHSIEIACRIGAKVAIQGIEADLSEFDFD